MKNKLSLIIIILGIHLNIFAIDLSFDYLIQNYQVKEYAKLITKDQNTFLKVYFESPSNQESVKFKYSIIVPFTSQNMKLILSQGLKKDRFFDKMGASVSKQSRFNIQLNADEILQKNIQVDIKPFKN
jgi:hypothetical protein